MKRYLVVYLLMVHSGHSGQRIMGARNLDTTNFVDFQRDTSYKPAATGFVYSQMIEIFPTIYLTIKNLKVSLNTIIFVCK